MLAALALCALASFSVAGGPTTQYHVARELPLAGESNFDDLRVDAGRLFVTHGTSVQIFDADGLRLLGTIENTPGAHSVAFSDTLGRGYISVGRSSLVVAFDLATFATITRIETTGENPDAIVYDDTTRRVFSFNGRGRNASVIDATANKVVATIALDAKPEFAVSDGTGRVFVNLEDADAVGVIDAKSMAVSAKWDMPGCESPTGLAIDRAHQRLFSACGNKTMKVLDTADGHVVASLPIGAFVDGAAFDPAEQLAFASAGDGTLTIVHEDAPDRFQVVENLATRQGARTMALDERTHRVYLSSASYVASSRSTAGQPADRRFTIVPDSYRLLVVEPGH